MMGHRDKLICGDEYDVVFRWPAKCLDRPGVKRYTKRKINRRARHAARQECRSESA